MQHSRHLKNQHSLNTGVYIHLSTQAVNKGRKEEGQQLSINCGYLAVNLIAPRRACAVSGIFGSVH